MLSATFSKYLISNTSQKFNQKTHQHKRKWKNRHKQNYRRYHKRRNRNVMNELILSGALCSAALIGYCTHFYNELFAEEEKQYFIGVDGGGTKTSVVCVDNMQRVIARVILGSSNQNSVGDEATRDVLRESLLAVIEEAGISEQNVKGVWLSMAGVDRPNDCQKISDWISDIFPSSTKIKITNDSYGALASGTDGNLNNNLVIISGTGSICVGFTNNQLIRTGGWGPLINDGASGYHMGSELLNAIAIHADGGKQTVLYDLFMKQFGLSDPGEIITWRYDGKAWSDIADLGKLVYDGVRLGDDVAIEILDGTVDGIVDIVLMTSAKMENCENIVLSGGNLTHENSLLTSKLLEKLKNHFPSTTITLPSREPAEATALLAKNILKD